MMGCGRDQRERTSPLETSPPDAEASSAAPADGIQGGGSGAQPIQSSGSSSSTVLGASVSPPDAPTIPASVPVPVSKTISTEPALLVAFIGDQGNNGSSDAVLELIKTEGAHATVHNGDFDYQNNPEAWEARINRILGEDYPYFSVIGNHDAAAWNLKDGYAERIAARHARVSEMRCRGEAGIRANCSFRGLHIIESCVGVGELREDCRGDTPKQVKFIADSLRDTSAIWSICAWHKNQRDMQVGAKGDEVGWGAYQACMKNGAIVITGHEHSYARTLTLRDVGNVAAGHGHSGDFDQMRLSAGSNFVLVSGLAGFGIRNYQAALHDDDTWWASYFASDAWLKNGVQLVGPSAFGALFIEFNVDGNPRLARGYFKATDGRIIDEFTIHRE